MRHQQKNNVVANFSISIAVAALLTSTAFGLNFKTATGALKADMEKQQSIYFHPFSTDQQPRAVSLFGRQLITVDDGVKSALSDSGLSPFIQIRQTSAKESGVSLYGPGYTTKDYELAFAGVRLCQGFVKAITLGGGEALLRAQFPNISIGNMVVESDWPDIAGAYDFARGQLIARQVARASIELLNADRCYFAQDGDLLPMWDMTVRADGLQYRVISDHHAVELIENRFFDATATIRAYEFNIKQSSTKDFSISTKGDGSLTNDYFTTDTGTKTKASEASHSYIYSTTDDRYTEAAAFAHINTHLDYLTSIGYTWTGAKPLKVYLHQCISIGSNCTVNNAVYQPSSDSTTPAYIQLGDGDGSILQNLGTDSDVVSHEFGHHIVYKTIKSVSGQSLVIHEGLADLFTFARSDDACLGESICPSGSTVCWQKAQCLRSADNTLVYNDSTYQRIESHLKGQIVSGFFWDLKKAGIAKDDMMRIAYRTLDFMSSSSDLRDLVIAAMLADKTYLASQFCSKIWTAAQARGLNQLTGDLNCSDSASWPAIGSTAASASSDSSSKKSGIFGCSVAAGSNGARGFDLAMALLLCTPAVLPFLRRRRR